MKRFAGIFILLLLGVGMNGRVGLAADGKIPDVAQVQRQLKQVFAAIRPDLKGKGFELEQVGGDLDENSGKWLRIRGEFRTPETRDRKRNYVRLEYRIRAGRPVDVRLTKGVMRGGCVLHESSSEVRGR